MKPRIPGHHLDRLLHRGDRTEVWAARSVADADRRVVVKTARESSDPDRRRSVEAELGAEAAVLASVDHPHLVRVIELLSDPVAIVMPWYGGGTVRDLLDERGALTAGELVAVLDPVVSALDALADHGHVHGDLKPANVLLDRGGVPVLADLGSARPIDGRRSDRVGPSSPGSGPPADAGPPLRSSPAYLDPMAVEDRGADPASDVWALGVVAYEALSGRLPHRGEPAETLALAAAGAHRPLDRWPAIPEAVAAVVESALEPDPSRRPAHAGILLDRLRAALPEDEPVALPGPATVRAAGTERPDHRTVPVGPRLLVPGSADDAGRRTSRATVPASTVRRFSRLLGFEPFVPVAAPTRDAVVHDGSDGKGMRRRATGGVVGIVDE